MTFKELAEGLTALLNRYPQFTDNQICHSSECGFSTAGFKSPITLALAIRNDGAKDNDIFIVSNDDGYRLNDFIKEWKFFSLEE